MKTLFEFSNDSPDKSWASTNDGVMGGRSDGGSKITPDGMLFSGQLSLENNGGFSSIHARTRLDLSSYKGIRLKVRGDGRTYQIRFQTDAIYEQYGAVNFSSEFKTTKDKWIEVRLPFDELNQTWRGRQLSGYAFNKKDIQRIGIMLADKKPGGFELTVASVAAE